MNTKLFKIDNDLKILTRPLTQKEYSQLEQEILKNGCSSPVTVWNDIIIDGYDEYEICIRNGIPYPVFEKEFDCRESAIVWICSKQLERKNLTEETKKFLIGMQYESEKVAARFRNKLEKTSSGGNLPEKDISGKHSTVIKIAKANNVSTATVTKYALFTRALEEIGRKEPKLVPKILSGQYKISHKNVLKIAELSEEEVKRINRKIEKNPADYMYYKATRNSINGGKYEAVPTEILIGPSVKDMPKFDPDAETNSLILTIPSWQSTIERMKNSTDFSIVSDIAKKNLKKSLFSLLACAREILIQMEDK